MTYIQFEKRYNADILTRGYTNSEQMQSLHLAVRTAAHSFYYWQGKEFYHYYESVYDKLLKNDFVGMINDLKQLAVNEKTCIIDAKRFLHTA